MNVFVAGRKVKSWLLPHLPWTLYSTLCLNCHHLNRNSNTVKAGLPFIHTNLLRNATLGLEGYPFKRGAKLQSAENTLCFLFQFGVKSN